MTSDRSTPPAAIDLRSVERFEGMVDGEMFARRLFRDLSDRHATVLREQPDGVIYARLLVPLRLSPGLKRQVADLNGEVVEDGGFVERIRFDWVLVTCEPGTPEGDDDAPPSGGGGWARKLLGRRR